MLTTLFAGYGRALPVALVALAAILAASGSQIALADDARSADDGWRRTVYGWERTESWTASANHGRPPERFIFGEQEKQLPARWDFHPATLVALQLSAVGLGFALSSRLSSPALSQAARRGTSAGANSLSDGEARAQAA